MNDTHPISETTKIPVHSGWMWPGLLVLLVWLISLAVTGVLWHQAKEDAHHTLRSDFERQATDIRKDIQRHLKISALILKSFTALFNTSDKVSRQDFHDFYKTLILSSDIHGFTGMSYEARIAAQDLNQYLAQPVNLALDVHGFAAVTYVEQMAAKDITSHVNTMRKMGYANYHISPPGTRAIYAPIVFIEPMTDSNRLLLGFDPFAVLPARTAMNQARDSGTVTLSAKLTPLSNVGPPIPDFVMYAPIYRSGKRVDTPERRRSYVLGWIDVPFRMTEFMAHVFPDGIRPLDLEIFDGSTPSLDSLMFDSDNTLRFALTTESPFRYVQSLDTGGRTWTLVFHALPGFGAGAVTQKPPLIAITGVLLSTLLALLTAITINAQRRRQMRVLQSIAIQRAQERDALRTQSEKALQMSVWAMNEAQRIARVGTYMTDIKTGLWQGSTILDDIFGIDKTFIKTIDNWNTLVAPEDRQALIDDYHQVIKGRNDKKFKHDYQVIRPCDGQRRWVTALGELTYDTEGKPVILRGTIQDITERKLSELELQQHRDHLATLVQKKTAKLQDSMNSTQHALAELEQQKQVLDHHAIVTITDPEGYIIYGNDKFTEISGYSPNEFLGKPHDLSLIHI